MKIEDLEILGLFQSPDWQNELAENMPDCFSHEIDSLKEQDIVVNLKNIKDNVYLSICFRNRALSSRIDLLFTETPQTLGHSLESRELYLWNSENENDKGCFGQDELKQQYKKYFPSDFFDKYLEVD